MSLDWLDLFANNVYTTYIFTSEIDSLCLSTFQHARYEIHRIFLQSMAPSQQMTPYSGLTWKYRLQMIPCNAWHYLCYSRDHMEHNIGNAYPDFSGGRLPEVNTRSNRTLVLLSSVLKKFFKRMIKTSFNLKKRKQCFEMILIPVKASKLYMLAIVTLWLK